MVFIILNIIAQLSSDVAVYRFQNGYAEIWYQMPSQVLLASGYSATEDTVLRKYFYRLVVFDDATNDSSVIKGSKGAHLNALKSNDWIIDYLPVYCYPGRFSYRLEIRADTESMCASDKIDIAPDTVLFAASDLVMAKDNNQRFVFHGLSLIPVINDEFTHYEDLITYCEIYGLIPDSLFYEARCQILDNNDKPILEKKKKCLKYAVNQTDTFCIPMNKFADGQYNIRLEIKDPAQNLKIMRSNSFRVRTRLDITKMKFYDHIQYLAESAEYKKFIKLDRSGQSIYLKNFWSKNNYWVFEKRLLEADTKFSTSLLQGRDTYRGRFYIKKGPADEIEFAPMELWARPFEVWHYYTDGYDVVFCDLKDTGNPEHVKTLKSGTLIQILEKDYRPGDEEDWIFEVAPGTYDDGKKEGAE